MLILTRKLQEKIIIGENAEFKITVLGFSKYHVKLGIDAPKNVPVHREEIFDKIAAEKAAGITRKFKKEKIIDGNI